MNVSKLIRTTLTATVLVISASAAQATTYNGQYTFMGNFHPFPTAPNTDVITRDQNPPGFPGGAFIDYYIFTIAPSAQVQITANFNPFLPTLGITGFDGGFFNVTAATCLTPGLVCTGVTIGSELLDFTTAADGKSTEGAFTLAAGTYAIQLRGNNVSNPNQSVYSGQVSFLAPPQQVPEPESLALLGIGLIGLALTRRRKLS